MRGGVEYFMKFKSPAEEDIITAKENFDIVFKLCEKFFKILSWVIYSATLTYFSHHIDSFVLRIICSISYIGLFILFLYSNIIFLNIFFGTVHNCFGKLKYYYIVFISLVLFEIYFTIKLLNILTYIINSIVDMKG